MTKYKRDLKRQNKIKKYKRIFLHNRELMFYWFVVGVFITILAITYGRIISFIY